MFSSLKDRLLFATGAARRRLEAGLSWLAMRRWAIGVAALVLLAFVYYLGGMAITHRISDDPGFTPDADDAVDGGGATVAMITALMDREVNRNGWVANDPFFYPTALLDNMPAYQQGLRQALTQVTLELRDQIGRTRGSSAPDPDLEEAVGYLNFPGDVWHISRGLPTPSSEQRYNDAIKALRSYNRRVARGDAVFERRVDNLQATLDRIALDLGGASAAIDKHVRDRSGLLIDFRSDNLFYDVKGRAYADYMVLTALRRDFASVVDDRELGTVWDEMEASLAALVRLDPWVVSNAAPDGQFLANHLTAEGFYLLRARTQLREITSILQK